MDGMIDFPATSSIGQKPLQSSATTPSKYQCSLAGMIASQHVPDLLERLVGLCGYVDFDSTENLFEHEVVFSPVACQAAPTGFGKFETLLRLRSAAAGRDGSILSLSERSWSLVFQGPPEPPKPGNNTSIRAIYESRLEGDCFQFLSLMGYTFKYEFVRKGFRFQHGSMTLTICTIHKVVKQHQLSTMMPPISVDQNWLVELNGDRVVQEQVLKMSDDLTKFASNLRGLLDLKAIDIT
ncbi:mediator complex, subunit Med18 [Zopfochytrium polystomum]|nr:mediator complex, subunit Med18 [Zopfochytrium polystomum]KAI9353074.1 mediator complex, subunit Med18 [Zopfochytrium polystomum]